MPRGRPSITGYRVRERFPGWSLLEVDLQTGRTHQIRVHLASIGHPVAGDPVYATGPTRTGPTGLERMFLHSWRIEFASPTGDKLIRAEAPLPAELESVLVTLRDSASVNAIGKPNVSILISGPSRTGKTTRGQHPGRALRHRERQDRRGVPRDVPAFDTSHSSTRPEAFDKKMDDIQAQQDPRRYQRQALHPRGAPGGIPGQPGAQPSAVCRSSPCSSGRPRKCAWSASCARCAATHPELDASRSRTCSTASASARRATWPYGRLVHPEIDDKNVFDPDLTDASGAPVYDLVVDTRIGMPDTVADVGARLAGEEGAFGGHDDSAFSARHFVEVAVDAAGPRGGQTFTYSVPDSLGDGEPGEAVLVEYGRRRALGVVMASADEDARPRDQADPRAGALRRTRCCRRSRSSWPAHREPLPRAAGARAARDAGAGHARARRARDAADRRGDAKTEWTVQPPEAREKRRATRPADRGGS